MRISQALKIPLHIRLMIPFTVLLLCAGCGGSDTDAPADPATIADTAAEPAADKSDSAPAKANVQVPDACTFFDRTQLEQTLGWELYDGEPEEMPPGLYACDFATPPQFYVSRTYPDPALPASVGFNSLKINTHPTTPEDFNDFREMLGTQAEDVAGIGDGAYFYGFDMLYVRVGNSGFSMRIYTNAQSDEDRALVREVMLTLGREGAAKLQQG